MEQRPLRLGDLVDDYCPRERRITNHAIVAIVENSVRQTRCSTCDTEHVYKKAKVPRRRKSETASVDEAEALVPAAGGSATEQVAASVERADAPVDEPELAAVSTEAERNVAEGTADTAQEPGAPEVWSTHRRLIRATLPKVEGGEPPPRPIPEFTMHQRQSRGSHMFRNGQGGNGPGRGGFRQGRPADGNSANGNGPGNGQSGGRGQGPDQGNGQGGRPGRSGRSGRRRSRGKRPQ